MDIQKKDFQPLRAIPAGGSADDHNPQKNRKRRLCCICCSTAVAAIVAVGLIILILALTVFKAREPVTTVNSVKLDDFDVSVNLIPLRISLNLSLDVDISVKNPNKVGFKYRNSTAVLRYKNQEVGDVPLPAGEIGADSTKRMNVTLIVLADRLITNSDVYSDVIAGDLPMSTYTRVAGKVRILKLFNIHVVSYTTCQFHVDISSRSIKNQTCEYKARL